MEVILSSNVSLPSKSNSYLPEGATTPGEATEEDQPDDKSGLLYDAKLKLSESVHISNMYEDDHALVADAITAPPIEPTATDSVDEGYLPSAVEEERSEEEDAIADKARDSILQDTEEESLAIAKFNSDPLAAGVCDKTDVALKEQTGDPLNAVHHDPNDERVNDTTAQFNSKPEADVQLLQPIIENPLSLLADVSSKSKSPEENVESNEIPTEEDVALKPIRGSGREIQHQTRTDHAESDPEQHDLASVQSETSSVRRSSRIRAKKSSPKVPSSITTGGRGKRVPALQAVPEDDKLEDTATVQSPVASRTNRIEKQTTETSVDDSLSIKEEGNSVASRTRRRGKRGADDDDNASHVSSVIDESSTATTRSKRAKTVQATKKTTKQTAREKQKKPVKETQSNASEPGPSPRKTRSGRSKIADQDDESKSVEKLHKARAKNNKKEKSQETESASSIVTRSSRRTRNSAKDNTAQSNASPPKTRGRGNKKDEEVESSAAPTPSTRSSRRTGGARKTTPSEGSESIASSRPRRNTRAPKR